MPASLERWALPDLRTWDTDGSELLYVTEAAPSAWRIRDLSTGSIISAAIPERRQIASAVSLREGIAYVAALGVDRYRPASFEVRMVDRATRQDKLLRTIGLVVEAGQEQPLSPGMIRSDDRSSVVWNEYSGTGDAIETAFYRLDQADGSVTTVFRTSGVAFPMGVFGKDLVIWKRPAGSQGSPTSIDTYLIRDGREQRLGTGAWVIDLAEDGRALFHFGGIAEIRDGLTGPVRTRYTLGTQGAPAIADHRIAWCSEQGSIAIFDLDGGAAQEYPAPGCLPRIHLDAAAVTWLETNPGKYALVRLRFTN